jgi:hypothetical protein
MAITVSGTSITFNDATVQSTAASAPSTAFGAIGTYAVLMNAVNSNLANGATIAGSSLRYDNAVLYTGFNIYNSPFVAAYSRYNTNSYGGGGTAPSGTWRKVSTGPTYLATSSCCVPVYIWGNALYVRIS